MTISQWAREDSAVIVKYSLILETSLQTEFSSEYFTEMLLSYIFMPSLIKYGSLSNKRCSKLSAIKDCLFSQMYSCIDYFVTDCNFRKAKLKFTQT